MRNTSIPDHVKALSSSAEEISKAHRLTDLEFIVLDGVTYVKRKSASTVFGFGRIWSWLHSLGQDVNPYQQQLKAFLDVQTSTYSSECKQFIASADPTSEKAAKLGFYFKNLRNCIRDAQKVLGSIASLPCYEVRNLLYFIDKELESISNDFLEDNKRLHHWNVISTDDPTIKKIEQMKKVVDAIDRMYTNRVRPVLISYMEAFQQKYEVVLLRKNVLEKAKESLSTIERYKSSSNPLLDLESDLKDPSNVDKSQLKQAIFLALRIDDLKLTFPDTYHALLEGERQWTPNISWLPSDVSRIIFRFLPISARGALACTSTKFNRTVHTVISDEICKKYLEKFNTYLWAMQIEKIHRFLLSLLNRPITLFPRELLDRLIDHHFRVCEFSWQSMLEIINTGQVSSLTLPMIDVFFYDQIMILPQIKTLTSLSLKIPDNSYSCFISYLTKFKNLSRLTISFNVYSRTIQLPTGTAGRTALANLKELRFIRYSNCKLEPSTLLDFPTTLETLELIDVTIDSQECLNCLERFTKLKKLVLKIDLSSPGLELKLPPNLSQLTISCMRRNGNIVPISISKLSILKTYHSLDHFTIEDFQNCSVDELVSIVPPGVNALIIITYHQRYLDETLFTKLGHLYHLRSLSIQGPFQHIDGKTLSSLSPKVRTIEILKERTVAT